jgi:cytochrome c553
MSVVKCVSAAALLAPLLALAAIAPAHARTLEERTADCVACHGPGGSSATPGVPSIAGQPQFFLTNQLILMREGVRPVPAMADVLKGLKDEEAVALAERFAASLIVRSDETADPALVKRGSELAVKMRCASCHMPGYEGSEQMPRLSGQRIDYMIDALKAYRDDKRPGADTAMTAVVYGASDADLAALAHYTATK